MPANQIEHTIFSDIPYQDDDFIIVNKPSGLLCVPGLSEPDNLFDRVKAKYPNARVVHRLDMATSGLVIFALHYEAQKAMSKLFEIRQVKKTYSALIFGHPQSQCGDIVLPIICDWPQRPKQKIDFLSGKMGKTFFRVNDYCPEKNISSVTLYPLTGRTHQLRIHMQAIGHPILGDYFYADGVALNASPRLCLHAETLNFIHPMNQAPLEIQCNADFTLAAM